MLPGYRIFEWFARGDRFLRKTKDEKGQKMATNVITFRVKECSVFRNQKDANLRNFIGRLVNERDWAGLLHVGMQPGLLKCQFTADIAPKAVYEDRQYDVTGMVVFERETRQERDFRGAVKQDGDTFYVDRMRFIPTGITEVDEAGERERKEKGLFTTSGASGSASGQAGASAAPVEDKPAGGGKSSK